MKYQLSFTEDQIDQILVRCRAILQSGWLSQGPTVEELETRFAEIARTRWSVAVSSGASALEIIFRALAVEGREVLVPANTNFATAFSAAYAGGKPTFYDTALYPDVAHLERLIHPGVGAVVVVHLGGWITPEMGAIRDLCEHHQVPLVEDAAHGHGATLDGKSPGTWGRAAAYSFFPSKLMTTGEGGMVCTNDSSLAVTAKSLRNHGKPAGKESNEMWGNSWRMTEMGAAVALIQADSLESTRRRRLQLMRGYKNRLGFCGLLFPQESPLQIPSGYKCVARIPESVSRDALKALQDLEFVLEKEIYRRPLPSEPVFHHHGAGDRPFPLATSFTDQHICLPVWPSMTEDDADDVMRRVEAAIATLNSSHAPARTPSRFF